MKGMGHRYKWRKVARCYPGAGLVVVLLLSAVTAYAVDHGNAVPAPTSAAVGRSVYIEPPAYVRRSGRLLRTFDAGSTVIVQSGCLACHRIDNQGNRGPGLELTHIASKLSRRQIEHAILDPSAPMPSFRRMPKHQFMKMVKMLRLLR
jgi:ubiquinol-cytochrome c reductase cytochrome b subunit/menaquinol-cytochrome c reductase cytochrome b/c subunit